MRSFIDRRLRTRPTAIAHYYDVAMMAAHSVKQEAFDDIDLPGAVVKHKQTFYASAWAQYPLAVPGTLRLTPPETRIQALRRDYRDMAVMIFGEPPTFDQIIEKLVALEKETQRTLKENARPGEARRCTARL
jgi:hypothetical protein